MDWFRWHHGTVNDPKFTIVARLSQQPKIAVLSVWAAILEFTSEKDDRGSLEGFDPEDVAAALDLKTEDVVTICHAMSQKKLIDVNCVKNWSKRQPKKEDDSATERKRAQRERNKEREALQAQLADLQRKLEAVTQGHAESQVVTQSHAREEQIRADKNREEKPSSSSSPSLGKETGDAFVPMSRREFAGLYFQAFGRQMSGMLNHDCEQICARYDPEKIRSAFFIAAENSASSFRYVQTVLKGEGKKPDGVIVPTTAAVDVDVGSVWKGKRSGTVLEVVEVFGAIAVVLNRMTQETCNLEKAVLGEWFERT